MPAALNTVTILSGASLSSSVSLGKSQPIALQLPAAWTAASVSFQVSADGTSWFNLFKDDGTEATATVGASQHIPLNLPDLPGILYLKVRSGTSALAVAQAADRVINVVGQFGEAR